MSFAFFTCQGEGPYLPCQGQSVAIFLGEWYGLINMTTPTTWLYQYLWLYHLYDKYDDGEWQSHSSYSLNSEGGFSIPRSFPQNASPHSDIDSDIYCKLLQTIINSTLLKSPSQHIPFPRKKVQFWRVFPKFQHFPTKIWSKHRLCDLRGDFVLLGSLDAVPVVGEGVSRKNQPGKLRRDDKGRGWGWEKVGKNATKHGT